MDKRIEAYNSANGHNLMKFAEKLDEVISLANEIGLWSKRIGLNIQVLSSHFTIVDV